MKAPTNKPRLLDKNIIIKNTFTEKKIRLNKNIKNHWLLKDINFEFKANIKAE